VLNADLDLARRFVTMYPPPGTLLTCAITGAHIYGFPSADSDLDIKGIHLAPTRALLGLRPNQRSTAHDITEDFEGTECDFTTNEAGEALILLLSGNGNMLERIFSPLQVVQHPKLGELREIAGRSLSQRFAKHYGGFFHGCRRELIRVPTVKGLLYSYRVALTGVHLLRTGEVETNVSVLAARYDFERVDDLVELKRSCEEHHSLDAVLLETHASSLDRLQATLSSAEAGGVLPAVPANVEEVNEWLIDRRLQEGAVPLQAT
jgi:uncharacterized protein